MPERTALEEIAWRLEEIEEAEGNTQALHLVTLILAMMFALLKILIGRRPQPPQ